MLPNLTPLQYLALHLLFVGRQSGDELRRTLRLLGRAQSRTAFSHLMARLVESNHVDPQSAARTDGGHTVHSAAAYEITDQGVLDWTAARKFYVNLAAIARSDPGGHPGRRIGRLRPQKAAVGAPGRDVHESLQRFASATLDKALKLPRKPALIAP